MHDPQRLAKVLDAAISAAGADFGNVQLYDVETSTLRIAVSRGFGAEFLEHFRSVSQTDGSACSRAVHGASVEIADVETDADFAPHRAIAARAGFRAVRSTPFLGSAGGILGVISTHFRQPGCRSPGT